jgi:predicted DNA-binding transcriptional regulator AlpA
MTRQTSRAAAAPTAELVTDPEGAALLNLGETRFIELQREADFPVPVWLGPRGKRHVRSELLAWALSRRQRSAPRKTGAAQQ